jgi:hypothetical protein
MSLPMTVLLACTLEPELDVAVALMTVDEIHEVAGIGQECFIRHAVIISQALPCWVASVMCDV